MQISSTLISLLGSGLVAAALNSHSIPADCTPAAVAYTTPAYAKPSVMSTMSFEQYGSPSASHYGSTSASQYGSPSVSQHGSTSASHYGSTSASQYGSASASHYGSASASHYGSASASQYGSPSASYATPNLTPMEYTPSSTHVTIKVSETSDCTTSSHPYQYTGIIRTTTTHKTTTVTSKVTSKVTKMTTSATPTHSTVQNVANRMDAGGVLTATVIAGLFLLM
ncbi:hypothetical protein V2A60_003911 [Cordyceps javanica]|nr:hypothetical protein IF2G_07942 [Cordyceps javanica]